MTLAAKPSDIERKFIALVVVSIQFGFDAALLAIFRLYHLAGFNRASNLSVRRNFLFVGSLIAHYLSGGLFFISSSPISNVGR